MIPSNIKPCRPGRDRWLEKRMGQQGADRHPATKTVGFVRTEGSSTDCGGNCYAVGSVHVEQEWYESSPCEITSQDGNGERR